MIPVIERRWWLGAVTAAWILLFVLAMVALCATPARAQSVAVVIDTPPTPVASCYIKRNSGNDGWECVTSIGTAANTALSNLASVAINVNLKPDTAGGRSLGETATPFSDLFVSGSSSTPGTNRFRITGASTGGLRTVTLADGDTTLVAGTMLTQTVADGLYDALGAAAAVTPATLNLEIGTDVQAWGAKLDAIQALANASGCLSNNGSGTFSYTSCGATPTEIAVTDDTTTNATMYPVWADGASGNQAMQVSSSKLTFNPSTGVLTATGFAGPVTGNASTATALQSSRTIYGNSFDGTANVTGTILPAYAPTAVALSDGATPALDASLGTVFTLTSTTNPTIAVPSNPRSGQRIVIAFTASGAARTLALNTGTGGFRYGDDVTGLTSTADGDTDYIGAIYNSAANKWDVIAVVKGYQ